jgi:hypothetical protein
MTLLNSASEGLPSELIVLARACAECGPIERDELVNICAVDGRGRLSGALSRWTSLGFFVETEERIALSEVARRSPRETLDAWTARLPGVCRRVALAEPNCSPLFGEKAGTSADLVKGLAWILAQDIFCISGTWKEIDGLEAQQLASAEKVLQNDVRWNALRYWARYLGFASSHRNFLVDPTVAIREEVSELLTPEKPVAAEVFVNELAQRLPVLDRGAARMSVEAKLDPVSWKRPGAMELSLSLSFALHRLELDQVIALERFSDTAQGCVLVGKGFLPKSSFSHVRLRQATK